MTAPVDPSGLDRLVGATLQALDQARGNGGDPTGEEDTEPVRGFGEAAEGMVRATAVAGGRIEDLQLDPRVLRMTTVTLSEEIMTAVNAALADLQDRLRDSAAVPDLNGLADRLREVQEESTRQMAGFLQALTDAQERIAAGGRR